MSRFSTTLCASLALLIGACIGTAQDDPFVPESIQPPAGAFLHGPTRMAFPESVGSFSRGDIDQFDRSGDDVSVGYRNVAYSVEATVYVYPAGQPIIDGSPPAKRDFDGVTAAIVEARIGTTPLSSDTTERLIGQSAVGWKARFGFSDVFRGVTQPIVTEAYLFGFGEWLVKYRFTFPAAFTDQADAVIREFLDRLEWPVR